MDSQTAKGNRLLHYPDESCYIIQVVLTDVI
jgi:hypothetical protein